MNSKLTETLRKLLFVGLLLSAIAVSGAELSDSTKSDSARTESEMGVLFPNAKRPSLNTKRFVWGADVGSSVDLTGHNLTTFDVNINCGLRNSIFSILGIGLGVQRSIGNSTSFVPIYGIVRTSFRKKPSNFFFNLKAGYSFNTLSSSESKGGFLFSTGGGIILKRTKRLYSFIMLAYGFYHINDRTVDDVRLDIDHVDFAQIVFGITF